MQIFYEAIRVHSIYCYICVYNVVIWTTSFSRPHDVRHGTASVDDSDLDVMNETPSSNKDTNSVEDAIAFVERNDSTSRKLLWLF